MVSSKSSLPPCGGGLGRGARLRGTVRYEGKLEVSYRRELVKRARALRRCQTSAEDLLWNRLRRKRLLGLRFRRQQPYRSYILDFYCKTARLVIEVDGDTHSGKEENDWLRDSWLRQQDLRVMRFRNSEVHANLRGVLQVIYDHCLPFARQEEG